MVLHCGCLQGVSDSPSESPQNGVEDRSEALPMKAPSSKRLYNWNTTHFYPDVHKLDDNDSLSVWRQRRHSEPRSFLRVMDNVSNDRRSSGSTSSSLVSFDEVSNQPDTNMPVSQLIVQLSTPTPHAATGAVAKVDVDLDSASESENDSPRMWHRSPLHVRRGRRLSGGGRLRKKMESLPSAGDAGELLKRAADRPSMRFKEQAEKRRKFLQQRCQVYGWDLTTDQQSAVDGHTEEQQQCVASQSQEDINYIDQYSEKDVEPNSADASSVSVKSRIRQFEATENPCALMNTNNSGMLVQVSSMGMSSLQSTDGDFSVKESSFENIYDAVSLEPDKSSDDVEVVQLYEPRQARVDAVYCYTKPLTSTKLPHADLQPSVPAENSIPNDGYKNLFSPGSVANTSVSVAACNVSPGRSSSAPGKSMRKSSFDAKSLVEEEKLKFVEYKIEYRRQQHSSGNESGSGKSDGEKNVKRQPEPSITPQKTIPPDDYEYILRKIHYNRPQNKADQKSSAGQPYQGSELHIEIKKPQMTTHHVTVDVEKPSVPHRVESLQHSGLQCQLPAKPDVIPSPNYPSHPNVDFGEGADISKYRLPRTVLHTNHQPVLASPSALPAVDESHVYQSYSGIRRPDGERFSFPKPQYIGSCTTTNSQNTEPDRKPPKPAKDELPCNRSHDFWHYNTTYEPSSVLQQQQPSQSVLSNEQNMWHTYKTEYKDTAKPSDRDLVHDLVRGLDENSELSREATAVFREQYRWSIHEPCHSVKPEQLKHNHQSQLPCSEVFVSSVCVPSKPIQFVHHANQRSLKDSSGGRGNKETVFSVTGYHKPQQLKTSSDNGAARHICLKDDKVYPTFPDVRDSHSNRTAFEPEPLYWYSEADKRKPIINSPEVETALNRDCRQRYFYCSSRQMNGGSLDKESSRNWKQSSEMDTGLAGWKHDSCHRDNYTESDVHKDVRLVGQKSQDRLVQQMSVRSQEATGRLHSNSSYCPTDLPMSGPRDTCVYAPCDRTHSGKSSTSSPDRQRPTEELQSLKISDHVPSRASSDYERHILHGRESYRSQVMAQLEPSSFAAICTTEDKSSNADIGQNMASVCTRSVFEGCTPRRLAVSDIDVLRHDVGMPSDRIAREAHDKKFGEAHLTNQETCEICEDEDPYPVTVAEIKAKLFGSSEIGARKLFRQQNGEVEGCQRGKAGGGKPQGCVTHSHSEQKQRSLASDELTDFEKLVERLDEGEIPLESCSNQRNTVPPSVSAMPQCNAAVNATVKCLSLTNVKVLEGNRGKQSPSLEYAKNWLISGRHASSVHSDKSPEHMLQAYAAEGNARTSTVYSLPPAENYSSFVTQKRINNLSCTDVNVCQHVTANNVSSANRPTVNVVTKSGMPRSTPTEGCVIFRSHQLSSIPGSSSSSFARRSLPALTEKDAERWRNMVSRIQENESNRDAKSSSFEQLSLLHSDPEVHYGSVVNTKTPTAVLGTASTNAQCKLAVSTHSLQHSAPAVVMPSDPMSVKPRRQQTPRDVKCRNESRTKCIYANTDSGYLDSEIDNHGRSVANMSKRIPSQSNESDELELRRNNVDEGDDIKLSAGSLSFTSVDSASTVADKNDTYEVSLSGHKEITESPKSRAKQLQKLREDWFSKNVLQSHSGLSDTHDSLDAGKSNTLNKDFAVGHSDSSEFERNIPLSLGLPKVKPTKPLYVSPLVLTSSSAVYRTPSSVVSGDSDDHRRATTVASTQSPAPSKVNTFKVAFPSHGPGQSTGNGSHSALTSPFSKVTHIPVRTAGLYTGQSPTRSSAFSPYVEHKDVRISRESSGGANVTEIKEELIQIEPEQYKASRLSERTVDQPSLKTYQLESEQFRHQRQEIKEPHVKITRQVTDSKSERTYRIESCPRSKMVPQLTARSELDKCETSDGEMTDATDITLDVMVGTNQLLSPTVDTVDFSDVEFLSSANLPAKKCDSAFAADGATPCVSDPFNKNLAVAHRIRLDDGSGDGAVIAAKAEMQLYKKNNEDVKRDEPPVERRRSIKKLVHSFEGMTSPFMRVRPRSMEIRISSSSDDEDHNDSVTERKHRNVTLRTSSSFKEAPRLDRKNRHQTAANQ